MFKNWTPSTGRWMGTWVLQCTHIPSPWSPGSSPPPPCCPPPPPAPLLPPLRLPPRPKCVRGSRGRPEGWTDSFQMYWTNHYYMFTVRKAIIWFFQESSLSTWLSINIIFILNNNICLTNYHYHHLHLNHLKDLAFSIIIKLIIITLLLIPSFYINQFT